MKNIGLKLGIILATFMIGVMTVSAAKNPYKEYSSFGKNCTWFAWDQVYKRLGIALPGWHDAQDWYADAQKSGYEVGQTPRANSIVVWKWDKYGHVAFVEKVVGDKIYIWDSNVCYDYEIENQEEYDECLLNSVSESTDRACSDKYVKYIPKGCEYPATYWQVPGDLIGYVYLDKIPSKTNNKGNSTTQNGSTSSGTPVKKSSNANLSNITISDIDFEFKKDIDKYELTIDSLVAAIKIEAKPEHSKAKVEGIGEYELKTGINTIKLDVTAEDGTKKTYTIDINKKDNNAYLSSLSISGVDFSFDKEILNYTLEVDEQIDKIKVEATTESELASVDVLDEYNLNIGNNTINIKVIAEDNTEKIYTLNIKRKEIVKTEETKTGIDQKYIVIGSIILLIGVGTTIALVIGKRKNKRG